MNLNFDELRCANCGHELNQGHVSVSNDVQMVKYCPECDFRMIIIIPDKKYNYFIQRELIKESV